MAEALRPCWRCGGEDVSVHRWEQVEMWGVYCTKCGIMFATMSPSSVEPFRLRAIWNERAADQGYEELSKENELLKQSLESYREEALGWHAQCDLLRDLHGRMVQP